MPKMENSPDGKDEDDIYAQHMYNFTVRNMKNNIHFIYIIHDVY